MEQRLQDAKDQINQLNKERHQYDQVLKVKEEQ